MEGLRNFTKEDLDAILTLAVACETEDKSGSVPTREQMEHQLSFPGFDVEKLIYLLPDAQGELRAMCGYVPIPGPEGTQIQVVLTVHPDHREGDLPNALLKFVEERSAAWQQETGQTARLSVSAQSQPPFYSDLYSRNGFQIVRWFLELGRDLTQPIPEFAPPPAVAIRAMENLEQDIPAFYKAFDESFRDHFNPIQLTLEQTQHLVNSPGFRADLTLLAFGADNDPAGVCASQIRTNYNAQNQTSEGMVNMLGVRRPYRKIGLGRALLIRGLELLREAGMTTAVLYVDAESPTGATRLYESVGFSERKRSMVFEKPLTHKAGQ